MGAQMGPWWTAHWTEVLGFGTGLLCVWLAGRRNVYNFPVGIANNLVFLWLFTTTALYGNAALQVVYLVLGVTGWYGWVRAKGAVDDGFVRSATTGGLVVAVLAGGLGTAVVALLLGQTDSTTELADAAVTSFSLVAQVLLNRRCWQTWWVWIAVDVAMVGLAASKGLWITGALYLIFIGLCLHGLRTWRRDLPVERAGEPVEQHA